MKSPRAIRLAWIPGLLLVGLAIGVWRYPRPAPTPRGPNRDEAYRQALPAIQTVRRNLTETPVSTASNAPAIRLRTATIQPGNADPSATPFVHDRPAARGYPWMVLFAGPIRPEWRTALTTAGATLRAYLPDNALLLEAPKEALVRIARIPGVLWSGEYRPAHKVQPLLAALSRQEPGLPIPVTVQTFAPEDAQALAADLAKTGATDVRAAPGKRWGLVRAVLPARDVVQTAQIPEVQWIELHEPPRPLNDVALATNRLNVAPVRDAHGLDGTGQIVAFADTGLDTGNSGALHPDFAGRLLHVYDIGRLTNWSDTYYHGTHVAGSLLGSGAASGGQYRGAAPAAQFVFQSFMTDAQTLATPDDLNDLYRPPYEEFGARIHSDSWGSAVAGEYNSDAMTTDEFVWDHPDLLVAYAAGNEGTDLDRNGVVDPASLDAPASAKNVLAVGASESGRPAGSGGKTASVYGSAWFYDFRVAPISIDLVSSGPNGAPQGLAAFSSRGPTVDGRTKPDVVAPGTDIVSVRSRASRDTGWGVLAGNTNYCFLGGTSMATPLAAGAATLVRQYGVERLGLAAPSAALLKAALAGGARSLSPGQYGVDSYREIPPLPRPNSVEGWGQIDVGGTLFPSNGITAILAEGAAALATGESNVVRFLVFSNAPLTVAMAYSDYPSALSASVNLVNDLDLTLVDPSGDAHYPNGLAGADGRNNLEGIDVAAAATGRWTLVVSARNVPEGPQPYALYLRGALRMPLKIEHEPLPNTFVTNADYFVSAEVTSAGPFDPGTVRLAWIASGRTGGFSSVAMSTTNGTRFTAYLPAQPVGTRIWYFLSAGPPELTAYQPPGAPAQLNVFDVAPAVNLDVSGSPTNLLAADPDYGTHVFASNLDVQARAIYSLDGTNGWRTACIGWQGTGSVPATGAQDIVAFTIARDSSLVWLWQEQVALMHTSSPYGAIGGVAWPARDTLAASWIAPESHTFNNVPLAFAGWTLDGVRFPPPPAPSRRQIAGIPMSTPRLATATYLPMAQDNDANGLPDWFELRYYGATGQNRYADPDDDGFENELEAADHTDPFEAASVPSPPGIQHVPLPSPATSPAPWNVAATITDNFRVASASLHWRRNGGLERSVAMTNVPGTADWFQGQIPSPARDGDMVVYRIEARDAAGFSAQSASWTVAVAYAQLVLAPAALTVSAPAASRTNADLFVWNVGSRPLDLALEIAPLGFADDMETGTNGWTRPDGNIDWHLSAQAAHSPAHAWYCGQEASRTYRNSTHAALVSPPIQLGAPAPRLDFMHWARFEIDQDDFPDGIHYWDSGVLEISDTDGAYWQPLVPAGGYPGLVTSNWVSPFAPDTPCFVDTDGWEPVGADLSAFAGRVVRLRFRFGADMYTVAEGWRIDDVVVSPRTEYAGWLTLPATNATVPAGLGMIFPLALDTATVPPMASGHLSVRIHHNDPERPSPIVVPIELNNVSRRVRVATEGPGQAAPAGEILVPPNAPFAVELAADANAFIADIQTNHVPVPLPEVVATQSLQWASLATNLDVQAVFAPVLANGLVPPEWLAQYGLTDRNWMAEASLDPDGDGLLTWQEHELDSNPTNPAEAPLRVDFAESPPPASNEWRLVWHAFTNRSASYDVLCATNMAAAFGVFTNLPAAPPVMTSPPLPPDSRFFGLRKR